MELQDIQPGLIKAIPGAAGSIVSMLFIKDTWPRKIAMLIAGVFTAWFLSPFLAKHTSLDEGTAGFLIGLFAMTVTAKTFDTWQKFDVSSILGEWVRKLLNLRPKEET